MVHYLFTMGSTSDRAKEFEGLVTRFSPQLDAAMLDIHVLGSDLSPSRAAPGCLPVDNLTQAMDRLSKEHPKVHLRYPPLRHRAIRCGPYAALRRPSAELLRLR